MARPIGARLTDILGALERGADGIYSTSILPGTDQADEIRLREAVAARGHADILAEISRHHSIPVMDRELRAFLAAVQLGGIVIDVGGGWGWHWRELAETRADLSVVIVDFVRANLRLAARVLGALVDTQIALVHADATQLPFPAESFDAYWSVQALQHVSRFRDAVAEAHRVLRRRGAFACYSLNRARIIEVFYRLMGRPYHIAGSRPGSFYLARASAAQTAVVHEIFGASVASRYTEILFHPELRLFSGQAASPVGALDARLSNGLPVFAAVARQRSYHVRKL
jgi:ubiquinone/menaquinone biosynthesis C-methylase UbiE